MNHLTILGCRLDAIDADEATRRIAMLAEGSRPSQVVTLGTEMVVHAQKDDAFRAVVNGCALALCDTVGLLAVARARGARLRERVTGVDLIEHVCTLAAGAGYSVYLFGGAPGVADAAAGALRSRYPGLRIAGTRHGFFEANDAMKIAGDIRTSGAQILFAGLGSPRQEMWLASHLSATGAGVGIGIGGSFDVISGRVSRAPDAFRRLHLEWFYRLLREPRRWRRQLALPKFVFLIVADGARSRFRKKAI